MRLCFALIAVLGACSQDEGGMNPIGGGGFDGGFGSGSGSLIDAKVVDAKPDSGSPSSVDAPLINGRVCLATDPRKLHTCASTGAGGLTVRLGNNVTTTNADGTFTISATTGIWRVTGTNIVTSIMNLT